ncbi:MAG: hypothetical protein JRH16_00070 [Deltaproteobacteria bacterium]|nr:hypothetical protein [Deltaproteobacteria bacterium]MBW2362342.1 hypothetical protein [Deltaproteobacteria bacterium]
MRGRLTAFLSLCGALGVAFAAFADETRQSSTVSKLERQEDFDTVWTFGVEPAGVTLVGFVYLQGVDPNGYPVPLATVQRLDNALAPRTGCRFLTASSRDALQPVLQDFGQDAVPLQSRDGSDAALFDRVAKVFLVDAEGGVRNIYSAGFLDHRPLLRDVETLLLER